ncbi:MAG: hypothetical protein IPL48_07365 [Bacteroidetes bacterium]|nr:hypothetical protein [Bacteroidota bacterium]
MKQKIKYGVIFIGLTIILASCTNNYEEGIKDFDEKKYDSALIFLRKVENSDKNYENAQSKIGEIDSILTQLKIEKYQQDSIATMEQVKQDRIARIEIEKKEFEEFKSKLDREIESFKTFDGSQYRGDISSIQIEIALFAFWSKIIIDSENHENVEINSLGKVLKSKVIALQKSEFPKMRKNYGEVLNKKLWTDNIKVKTKGSGYTTLEFEGGVFANNQNKQDTQQALSDILNQLRFKRINYKWYEYDDEYTYYSLKTGQDGDLVVF